MNPSALNGTRDEDYSKRSKRQPSFRLTDLAADPRGRIYHKLLTWPANDHNGNHSKRSKKKPPFRLLALPPDLRGRIYHELLTWPEGDYHLSTCHPQILTVSKQVKAEAEEILYKENIEVIHLALRQQTRALTSCLLSKITGRPIHNVNLIEKYWVFEQGVKAFFGLSRGDGMTAAVVSQQQQHLSLAATQLEMMALEEGWVDAVWEERLIRALVVVGTFLKANGY
ncbi:hypothetical protein D0867_03324 [Hortaea werneckii]|uniref:Uncharacterized protein n=1 Tax=Hortaea werneckii TaxID=91943 RepID=A0A3M7B9H0_HORWE|nr:hypothetical protein D0867_03324 [Hortaea werneckii]RMY36317.1 hypothetical protein D0866_04000 [Hortaea werneckii]